MIKITYICDKCGQSKEAIYELEVKKLFTDERMQSKKYKTRHYCADCLTRMENTYEELQRA